MFLQKSTDGFFSPDEIERARRYHRPRYVAFFLDIALGLGVLAVLAFTGAGAALYPDSWPWWAAALVFPPLVLAVSELVRLPTSLWRGWLHERRWGFSTQDLGAWAFDRLKGIAIGTALGTSILFALVALARAFPSAWPALAAPGAALVVLLLTFVAPVLLEPIFNRFEPLRDELLAAALVSMSIHAGVPVRRVLVADASRRTHKTNAYVSGLGATRRVVLFDTLLERTEAPEIALVVAHELGHRRHRDVLKLTALGMVGTVLATLVLWLVFGRDVGDPREVPAMLLSVGLLELLGLPFAAAASRRFERRADRFSLELLRDVEIFERAHRRLALENLSDLDPPRALYLLTFSHPTPPERIADARRRAAAAPL
jgi:STE24 endopeptidase